ncbi:MAG: TlpA family protein disulfide reductase [Gammaproteobacteria bacterium]
MHCSNPTFRAGHVSTELISRDHVYNISLYSCELTSMRLINPSSILRFALLFCALITSSAFAKGIQVQTLAGENSPFGDHIKQGKWTIVMVWTTYCGVCRQEYPKISEFHERHKERDAVVLGISLDGFGQGLKVEAYRQKHDHAFPSLLANAEEFAEPYEKTTGTNFSGTPTYLIFDDKQQLQAFKNGKLDVTELEAFIAE